jgi:hypothetical protein
MSLQRSVEDVEPQTLKSIAEYVSIELQDYESIAEYHEQVSVLRGHLESIIKACHHLRFGDKLPGHSIVLATETTDTSEAESLQEFDHIARTVVKRCYHYTAIPFHEHLKILGSSTALTRRHGSVQLSMTDLTIFDNVVRTLGCQALILEVLLGAINYVYTRKETTSDAVSMHKLVNSANRLRNLQTSLKLKIDTTSG